ncbi:MAG: alkaline phosphatase family protein [Acidobacteria bacterium]|nr:alkaline phosphatase family protein [Acidobacteriota bacterium]
MIKRIIRILTVLLFLMIIVILGAQLYSKRTVAPAGEQVDRNPAKTGVFRIAFGSCNKQWKPNFMWRAVLNGKPDLWIWLGDSIDAATEDMEYLKSQYEKQKQKPEYAELMKACPIIGTWDDNDYGMKNGNKHYSKKIESQQLFLDFIDEPKDSPRRKQEGVYASYIYGNPGKRIKVVLLDLHYNADAPGPESDLLGEKQWKWLEYELKDSKNDVVLLGSSLQLLSSEHPFEHWGNYPKSRERILRLLAAAKPKLTVILSGDRHLGEISRWNDSGLPYPHYEITSSGLTHHVDFFYHLRAFFSPEMNQYRVEALFCDKNFGVIDVDFVTGLPVVSLQIRDQDNQIQRRSSHSAFSSNALIQPSSLSDPL